jgi:hypothetical protein
MDELSPDVVFGGGEASLSSCQGVPRLEQLCNAMGEKRSFSTLKERSSRHLPMTATSTG